MRKYVLLSELADAYPIMVSLYPNVFVNEDRKLCVIITGTLEKVLQRIDNYKGLLPMNRDLILLLYGTEKAFYINKERKSPLEDRILRLDRGLGNPVDIQSLAIDMGVTPVEDDLSEQIYRQLYYDTLVYAKGSKVARREMDKFLRSDKERMKAEISALKSLSMA